MTPFSGVVRPLIAADRLAWLTLWVGYLGFYQTDLAPDVTEATFARLTGADAAMFGLVAEQDGRIVGIAHCIAHRSTWAQGQYLYLNDLFVAPTCAAAAPGAR